MFCERALRRSELAVDPRFDSVSRRVENREILRQTIEAVFAPFTRAEVLELLDAAGIANSRLNDLEDVWNHPQLAARKRWRTVETPAGQIPALLPPAMPGGAEPRLDPVPALGEHVDAVLAELGYSQPEIDRLRAERVVG